MMDTLDSFVVKDALDTALLVTCYRARASERPDGHIQDPYARLLAGERGEKLRKVIDARDREIWGIVMRTSIYDEIILRLVKNADVDTVINLAAGLDTRPYRLALPEFLRWIEYDLPEVLAYKQEKLAGVKASCIIEQYPLDITDDEARQAALAEATKGSTKTLVLAEGLLIYLPYTTVVSLATDLRDQQSIRWWLTEIPANKDLTEKRDNIWNNMASADARILFTTSNGIEFFSECGWDIEEFRYVLREILRSKLPLKMPRFVKFMARLTLYRLPKKPSPTFGGGGFALLKPADTDQDDEQLPAKSRKKTASIGLRFLKTVLRWAGFY